MFTHQKNLQVRFLYSQEVPIVTRLAYLETALEILQFCLSILSLTLNKNICFPLISGNPPPGNSAQVSDEVFMLSFFWQLSFSYK